MWNRYSAMLSLPQKSSTSQHHSFSQQQHVDNKHTPTTLPYVRRPLQVPDSWDFIDALVSLESAGGLLVIHPSHNASGGTHSHQQDYQLHQIQHECQSQGAQGGLAESLLDSVKVYIMGSTRLDMHASNYTFFLEQDLDLMREALQHLEHTSLLFSGLIAADSRRRKTLGV
jgi:hypothetical protein